MTCTLFNVIHLSDLYEVSLNGYVIRRISLYRNGDNMRQDVDFDETPVEVQERIIDKIEELLNDNA